MTDQANLDYDVSISARNAASLRGHFLNSNPRGMGPARQHRLANRWNVVVLQDLSDEPLPPGPRRQRQPAVLQRVRRQDRVVGPHRRRRNLHRVAALRRDDRFLPRRRRSLCQRVQHACGRSRRPTAMRGPDAEIFLYQTWARPDMIAPNGTNANGPYYSAAEGLEAMTADFHDAYFGRSGRQPEPSRTSQPLATRSCAR